MFSEADPEMRIPMRINVVTENIKMCFVLNMQINTNNGIRESFIFKSPPQCKELSISI